MEAGTIGTDTVKSGLMYRITDFLNFGELFFELGVRPESVEAELRVVLRVDWDAFSELEVNDSD